MKLSSKLQVWVPIELMSVVQSLWARAQQQQPEESADQEENFLAHEIRIWALFLRTVHQTKPKYSLPSHLFYCPAHKALRSTVRRARKTRNRSRQPHARTCCALHSPSLCRLSTAMTSTLFLPICTSKLPSSLGTMS